MGSFFYLRALLAPQQRSGLNERPKTSFIGCPPFCHLLRETQASEASPGNHTVDYHVYFGSFLAIRPINVDTPKPLRSTKKITSKFEMAFCLTLKAWMLAQGICDLEQDKIILPFFL